MRLCGIMLGDVLKIRLFGKGWKRLALHGDRSPLPGSHSMLGLGVGREPSGGRAQSGINTIARVTKRERNGLAGASRRHSRRFWPHVRAGRKTFGTRRRPLEMRGRGSFSGSVPSAFLERLRLFVPLHLPVGIVLLH